MAVRIESQRVVWHARPPATTLRGLIPRGPGRLGARRTGRESSRASLTTFGVVWEFAQVLCSTRLVFSPRFDVGKGEEASCGSATPDEAGESPTEARPGDLKSGVFLGFVGYRKNRLASCGVIATPHCVVRKWLGPCGPWRVYGPPVSSHTYRNNP